ncbi:MAG: LysR family transcriptional regulator [Lachnospiraceae bacterium]|uniref:LysR family transcriptional regulator n=1 Tax=Candidatus Weimeria bifida TaxID=2599074 RepID=A0A6N7IZY5_9FIRM|nr:LysR family transcriptional regulator [Candidatus Weimeria bifida]RRF96510.1 MAG: LysR family transcriptional regulator [Lachnospiraceae bacterium]
MTLQQLNYVVKIAETKSMNKAAKELFVTQSALSSTIKLLEEELGTHIFIRSNRGMVLTSDGEKFLQYAKEIVKLSDMVSEHFSREKRKTYFSVSMQHYSFAVEAFVKLAAELDIDSYDLAVHETMTARVMENVRDMRSELGVMYLDDANRAPLTKTFKEYDLEFTPLFDCPVYVFLNKDHPLAKEKKISFDELADYPCLSFDQGENNAFYLSEEVLSTKHYPRIVRANDRASMIDLMIGLNGYTLCSGIIVDDINDGRFTAVPFDSDDVMTIGYIRRKNIPLSDLAKRYIELLKSYHKE